MDIPDFCLWILGMEECMITLTRTPLHVMFQSLVVNTDETGVRLLPMYGKKRTEKGAQEVNVLGADDKRQITACVSMAASGDLPGLQVPCETGHQ